LSNGRDPVEDGVGIKAGRNSVDVRLDGQSQASIPLLVNLIQRAVA
jgi:hypothetical protein